MSYATLQDLIERAGETEILETADRDQDGVADTNVVEAALDLARQTIDSYLAARYQLPLAPVPDIARGWAVSLARYTLHRFDPPDYVVRDRASAMAELRDASAGRLAVPGGAGLTPERSRDGAAIAEGSPQVFGDRNLEGWL